MRNLIWIVFGAAAMGALLWAADWPSASGNPQRDGWSRGENQLSRESAAAGRIELLYKFQFDNRAQGLAAMTQPIVLGNLIGYKGFKELLFIGGSSDVVYALDADLGKLYFRTPLDALEKPAAADSSALCGGGLTADLAMGGNSAAGRRGGGPPPPPPGGRAGRGPDAAPAVSGQGRRRRAAAETPDAAAGGARGAAPAAGRRGGGGGGRTPAVFWAVGGDGYLRTLRQQDGDAAWIQPAKFLPAGVRVSGLNVYANTIYASTVYGCGGNPNGLYAAAFTPPQMPPTPGQPLLKPAAFDVIRFMTNGSGFAGTGGTVIGSDGTIYGMVAEGRGDVAGTYSDTVLALTPDELAVKDYFTPAGSRAPLQKGVEAAGPTPVVFPWNGADIVVAGGRDGRLYLLDASAPGGADHRTPLSRTGVIVAPDAQYGGNGIWGALATWEDSANNNARWLYAAIRGPAAMPFPISNGAAPTGAIVAFKVEDAGGKPALTPQWISRDMTSPAPPVTGNGLVFALSTGATPRVARQDGTPYTLGELEKMAKHAILYGLDGATGKELFSSGNTATTFAYTGLALANGRVYFSTHDSNLYAYGIPMEH